MKPVDLFKQCFPQSLNKQSSCIDQTSLRQVPEQIGKNNSRYDHARQKV